MGVDRCCVQVCVHCYGECVQTVLVDPWGIRMHAAPGNGQYVQAKCQSAVPAAQNGCACEWE